MRAEWKMTQLTENKGPVSRLLDNAVRRWQKIRAIEKFLFPFAPSPKGALAAGGDDGRQSANDEKYGASRSDGAVLLSTAYENWNYWPAASREDESLSHPHEGARRGAKYSESSARGHRPSARRMRREARRSL